MRIALKIRMYKDRLTSKNPFNWVTTTSIVVANIFLISMLLAGCATAQKQHTPSQSTAYMNYATTTLGQLFSNAMQQHAGLSGFSIISQGRTAFTARIALTELAEKSLDLQYYLWEEDETGWILADRLVRAADRGVRVRVLVDDIGLSGRDARIAALDSHPNIEIRIFNPLSHRNARLFDFAFDLNRVNHRMHNKIMVADNAMAIVGGRNIGNHYFGVATDANFRDLDIATAGPVVREISTVFDHFWNGSWAMPINALAEADEFKTVVEFLHKKIATSDYPFPLDQDVNGLSKELSSIRDGFIWAPGQIVWDDPKDIEAKADHGNIYKALYKKLDSLEHELLIESAYFVAREPGIEQVKRLRDRGVKVRVLTNSLASNDVLAAHAGYAKYRKQLLSNGLDIYEMRPDASVIKKKVLSSKSKAALHTKSFVFDRESVFIGSFNLDPRSSNINTEAGLYVESPALAAKVVEYMNEGVLAENSYQTLLDKNGKLYWITNVDGIEVRYNKEPETTFGQRFMSGIIKLLPFDSQL